MDTVKYGFGKTVSGSFERAVDQIVDALQAEGFGVLSDIDVAATLKQKLDEDMPPYRILGACNPSLAHKALSNEPSIGLLLPCNVVVREDNDGRVHVDFMDPESVMSLVGDPGVIPIANEVKGRLERVMAAL